MKKVFGAISLLALLLVVGLTGCGVNKNPSPATTSNTSNELAQTVANQSSPSGENALKDGISKLLHTAKQLNKAIIAGEEKKIKETGPQLEEIWKSSEEGVKAKYPDLYAKVEQYLDPTVAGSKATPVDKDVLSKLDNQLVTVLYSLSEKVIPVEQVKTGAEKLLKTAKELEKAINSGDQAMVKKMGPQLEETWSTFEDGAKPRSPELYEKIETSLNPEVAGSQTSVLDKDTMGKLNNQLIQTLNELLQKLH
ncbi:MAG TPA: hypothetical protein VFF14_09955 [Candidatus Deferrimicrobium sp.]|nr:hypothetical protein [Candidatus Deferrimicrobium sp.]